MILKALILSVVLSPIICESVDIQSAMLINSLTSMPHPCTVDSGDFEINYRGCSWFWLCRDNVTGLLLTEPIEGICPENLHFNREGQSCTYDDGSCVIDDNLLSNTETSCTPWRMDLIPHDFECDKYYMCWENYTIARQCEPGYHFSSFQNGCVETRLANCQLAHDYCRRMKRNNEDLKRSRYSCEEYHACNDCNGRYSLLKFQCRSGTHFFDESLGHCDTFVSATSQCTPFVPNVPDDIPREPHSMICSNEDIFIRHVPHPNDCQFYFNCASGRSFLTKCYGNSYFHPDIRGCYGFAAGETCESLSLPRP